jgi:predicted nucleotidyltransferase
MDNSEFVTVGKPYKKKIDKTNKIVLSYYELVEIIYSKLIIHKNLIVGAFIYGSRARGTNRNDSDADIIIFWRKEYDVDFLKSIRDSIEDALGFHIDFVSCVFVKRWITHETDKDQAYFDNVILDAKLIIGSEVITYLIDQSYKLPKLLR